MSQRKPGRVQSAEIERKTMNTKPDVNEGSAGLLCYPSFGSATGLHDSTGRPIHIGDKVKTEVTGNTDYHGEWAIYEVVVRGMIPVLMYVKSEKGGRFPRGYTGCALSEKYDAKMFLWGSELADVRPYDEMTVVDG